jgi:hypothetical protein
VGMAGAVACRGAPATSVNLSSAPHLVDGRQAATGTTGERRGMFATRQAAVTSQNYEGRDRNFTRFAKSRVVAGTYWLAPRPPFADAFTPFMGR